MTGQAQVMGEVGYINPDKWCTLDQFGMVLQLPHQFYAEKQGCQTMALGLDPAHWKNPYPI